MSGTDNNWASFAQGLNHWAEMEKNYPVVVGERDRYRLALEEIVNSHDVGAWSDPWSHADEITDIARRALGDR